MKFLLIFLLSSYCIGDTIVIENTPVQIKPIKPIKDIPPIGTQQCIQEFICDGNGNNCKWIMVCK